MPTSRIDSDDLQFRELVKLGESPGSWRVKHDRISPELARKLYAEVQELVAENSSPVSLARRLSASHSLSLSPGTIRHWIVGDRNPQGRNVFRNVFKQEPSPSLSYVIGANIGDGCTLTENWIVKLEVTDYDFAETFNNCMANLFSRVSPNKILVRHAVGRLPMYVVKYSCKQLAKLLRLPLSKILEIALVFPREFLRGFFDAEGHVDVGAKEFLSLLVGAENSDKSLLLRIKKSLKLLGIESRIQRKRKKGSIKVIRDTTFAMRRTSYGLIIGKIEDVKMFAKTVGFSINRKAQKLSDALSIISTAPPKRRTVMWGRLYFKKRGEWVRRKPLPTQMKEYLGTS
jgi:intein-encoded DNA endonuclease-like protein